VKASGSLKHPYWAGRHDTEPLGNPFASGVTAVL